MRTLILLFILFFGIYLQPAHGELTRSDVTRRTVTVLLSTDTSGYNLSTALQTALAQLYRESGPFNVQLSAYVLPGFTPEQTSQTFVTLATEIFGFAYMEKERISLFLFDRDREGQFIVASESLSDPPNGQLTSNYLEAKLRSSFRTLLALYRENKFQWLPGSKQGDSQLVEGSDDAEKRRAAEAGLLFRELTSLQQTSTYIGANFGMARFASAGTAASTVSFGAYFGYSVMPQLSLELGMDVFSYALLHLDARYRLPIAGKYVKITLSAGVARIMFLLTQNRGFDSSSLPLGQFLAGPGISFDVPLLGATIRGGLHFYTGSGSILMGTYGVSYNINL